MRDEYPRFEQAGGAVVAVTMGSVPAAAAFRTRYRLPFRCLADPGCVAYRAYGVPRGGLGAVAGPRMWTRGWKALLRFGVGRVSGDPYQLPGSFVIDRQGIIRHAHRAETSAAWASTDELIAALEAIRP